MPVQKPFVWDLIKPDWFEICSTVFWQIIICLIPRIETLLCNFTTISCCKQYFLNFRLDKNRKSHNWKFSAVSIKFSYFCNLFIEFWFVILSLLSAYGRQYYYLYCDRRFFTKKILTSPFLFGGGHILLI